MYTIKDFKPRIYQQTILNTCSRKNCLIILPTGLGKTKTAILVTIQRLNNFPNSKILFLTPTKPLANQIAEEFINATTIEKENISVFTGEVKPDERERIWKESVVIVSTPQGLTNDIISQKISLEEVSCLVFDEAHRAVGDYDYAWIAKRYSETAKYPRIMRLTASPGSEKEKISEVCRNLNIEEIEVRTDQDEDVKPYIQEVDIDWIKVELPLEFYDIRKSLYDCYNSKLNGLKKWGLIGSNQKEVSKKQILMLQGNLHGKLSHGERDPRIWSGVSLAAEVLKVQHALELLETQGIIALNTYMDNLVEMSKTTKVKATKNLVNDPNFKAADIKIKILIEKNIEHPKLIELKKIIERETRAKKDVKIIIFNQYRDSAAEIERKINLIPGVKAKLFVGQLKKSGTGLSQKEQIKILDEFKEGKYNVIVTTSIAEEGLDIVSVDLVVFYEPVPSAIRSIQRRGRTGRQSKGRVIIMITKGTRDEA
ncbi:DEAD/DEAH box helicase, partial [Candidatus Woesearchaeota archaeon]|nr:DEAD/DEAH box helicase [Candidatus Woesearchaeota archaeon]